MVFVASFFRVILVNFENVGGPHQRIRLGKGRAYRVIDWDISDLPGEKRSARAKTAFREIGGGRIQSRSVVQPRQ